MFCVVYIAPTFTTLTHQHNTIFFCHSKSLRTVSSMASLSSSNSAYLLLFAVIGSLILAASAGDLRKDFEITWGDGRAKMLNNGEILTLSMDKASGSGFESRNQFMYGQIDMQLKLVAGNSAGTVTAYYVSS